MQQEVKAILTAEDRGYTSTMKNALGVTETFGQKIKSGIGFGVLMRAGQKCFDVIGSAITSNLAGATKRFDTLNNYPKVMQALGYSAEQAKASMDTLGSSIDHLPTTLDKVASQRKPPNLRLHSITLWQAVVLRQKHRQVPLTNGYRLWLKVSQICRIGVLWYRPHLHKWIS